MVSSIVCLELLTHHRRLTFVEQCVSEVLPDDAQLVTAARDGNRDAYGALVERYEGRVLNVLFRVLGSREDASDVAQDAFVQAFVKLESFREESKFYTWLYRIAMNLALSHRRRRRATVSMDEMNERVGDQPIDQQPDPGQGVIDQEQAEIVQRVLGELAPEHRQILVLREMEDCSYETLAEILKVPIGTVRSRLFRARLSLKKRLENLPR